MSNPASIITRSTRRNALRLGAGAALVGPLAGCGLLKGLAAFNYRFSLTIGLNGRKITGSAVQRFLWNGWSYKSTASQRMVAYNKGESAVVDLSDGGVVVSTSHTLRERAEPLMPGTGWGRRIASGIGWPVAEPLAGALLPPKSEGQDDVEWWLALTEISESRPVPVPLENLPLLLWFPDRETPSNVIPIDALEPISGQPGVLGAEVAITSEPMTDGALAAALPWFVDYHSRRLALSGTGGVAVTGDDVAARMHSWSLKTDR
ncbi:hypothetical protein [Brevundimonas sp.]|uniref:hypothetical protein n=1 Tax=Brevundimonas sp. TaxID=1871086 RepID=UPI003F6E8CE3